MRFTDMMYESISDVFEDYCRHPFYLGLASGRLKPDVFRLYLVQDSFYLTDYARAASALAAKAPDSEQILSLLEMAVDGLKAEKNLHESLFFKFDVRSGGEYLEGCREYGRHILTTVKNSSFEVGLSALLPCFWLYGLNGKRLLMHALMDGNPYSDWIATYSDDSWDDYIMLFRNMTDSAAQAAGKDDLELMSRAFKTSFYCEKRFLDTVWAKSSVLSGSNT